jgi:hypothetical protein
LLTLTVFYNSDPAATTQTNIFSAIMFALLGPCVFLFFRNIFNDFTELLENSGNLTNSIVTLFAEKQDYEDFKKGILNLINKKWEKYFSTGIIIGFGIPIIILVNWQQATLFPLIERIQSSPVMLFQLIYWIVFWMLIYSIFISIVWMIGSAVTALYRISKINDKLHIRRFLFNLRNSCQNSNRLVVAEEAELLEVSFIRFKGGLSSLTDFTLSLSLKFAFIGIVAVFPQITYTLLSKNYLSTWYYITIGWCVIGIVFFAVTQNMTLRMWSKAKKETNEIMSYICVKKTEILGMPTKRTRENEKFLQTLNRINELNIKSAYIDILKVFGANLIVLLPVIVEIVHKF